MILYHIITTYQLLSAITHRYIFNRDKEAAIIVPSFIDRKFPQYRELTAMFDKLFVCDYIKYHNKTEEQVVKAFNEDFDGMLGGLDAYEDIIVGGAHYYFSVYLAQKGRHFTAMEDAAGQLSHPEMVEVPMKNKKKLHFDLIDSYGMIRLTSPYIDRILCLLREQKEGYHNDKAVDFDVVKNFSLLRDDELEKIMRFFRCPQTIDNRSDSALVLTQHFANQDMLTFEGQIMLYQALCDYFFEGMQVIIKPHPDDVMYYSKLFPEALVIKERFPSELLPFVFRNKPDIVSAISSASVSGIESVFRRVLRFEWGSEKDFEHIHRYYFALKILAHLGVKEFSSFGCSKVMINNLLRFTDLSTSGMKLSENSSAVIFGNVEGECELYGYETAVFLDCGGSCSFAEFISIRKTVPVIIKPTVIRSEDNYFSEDEQVIFVYAKDEEKKKLMKSFFEEKKLPASGTELKSEPLDEKDVYIKLLEGQVRMLENKLTEFEQRGDM